MLLHTAHHPLHPGPQSRELRHLFWSNGLGALGIGMVQLLVPAYLMTLGFSLPDICVFMGLMYGAAIPLQYLSSYLMRWWSPNWLMAIGDIAVGLFFVSLLLVPLLDVPLWVPALVRAIDKGFYWPAYHVSFSKSRQRSKGDAQVGMMHALLVLSFGVAPAIGGVVAGLFGIEWVYGVSAGLVAASSITILTGKDLAKHRRFQPSLLSRRIWPDIVANLMYTSMFVIDLLVWPLIIFLLLKSYVGVGILSSVIVLSSALVAYVVGKRADRRGERHYIKEGSWLTSLTNALRLVAVSAAHVFGVNLLAGVGQSLLSTSFSSRYYKHADKEPRLEYIWAMETTHLVGWVVLMAILFGLSSALPASTALLAFVVLAVPLSFGVRLMR